MLCRLVSVVSIAVFLFVVSSGAAAEPASRPQFVVSFTDLGAVPQLTATPVGLADELNAAEWCAAKGVATKSWLEPPKGVDAKQWLSIVVAGFGEQAQAYAFQVEPETGAIRVPARVAHRRRFVRGALSWTSPYSKLLGEFRVAMEQPNSDSQRPPLRIEFVESRAVADSTKNKPATPAKNSLDDALTLAPEKVFPPVQAMVVAAAYEAGWLPMIGKNTSDAKSAATARVQIGVLDQACSFRITIARDEKDVVLSRDRVPWEEYHDQLAHLFRQPLASGAVTDFARLSLHGAHLLAAEGNRIACVIDDELATLDAATGLEAWRVRIVQSKLPTVPKKVEQYVVKQDESGRMRLIRWTKSLAEFHWEDGTETKLAPLAASHATAFDVTSNGTAVVVTGNKLSCFSGGKEIWSVTEKQPITCGPSLDATRVIIGNDKGELAAFTAADGKPQWRVTIARGLLGEIGRHGERCYVFSHDDETVRAISSPLGDTTWKFTAGDMLLQPPRAFGKRVLVVTKQNRIALLDATNGSLVAEARWPTWIVSATVVTKNKLPALAVSDVSGRVALLDEALKTTWETRLADRRTGNLAMLEMPVVWRAAKKADPDDILSAIQAEGQQRRPLLLTTDAAGFLEKISWEGK